MENKKEYAMAQVKGVLILGLIKFVKKGLKESLPTIMPMLSVDTKKYMEEHISPAGWYPYPVLPELLRVVDKVMGNGDLGFCIEQGRLSAQRDLSTIFSSVLSSNDPQLLIRKAMTIWSSYYDVGKAEMKLFAENEISMVIQDFPEIDMAHVKSTQGWIEQLLKMSNYEDVTSGIEKCQCTGDPVTELHFRFRPRAK
ncbi:MAG: hypothetical protein M1591_06785 [Deltaproteobacteria bacterium]|nr:hypothetical protein [Deltaproteobacteria bacterium]